MGHNNDVAAYIIVAAIFLGIIVIMLQYTGDHGPDCEESARTENKPCIPNTISYEWDDGQKECECLTQFGELEWYP